MSDVPLPEPVDDVRVTWRGETEFLRAEDDYYTANQMHAHAAAVSAADNAALRERVRVLEGALEGALKWGAALSPDEHAKCRAALKRED
jgi:hypothetical protein